MRHYYLMNGPHPYSWLFGLVALIFWLAVIAGTVYLVMHILGHTSSTHHSHVSGSAESPLDIAKARYAKGEIDKEQFETLRKDLKD